MAGLRFLGETPCPRCKVPRDAVKNLGSTVDRKIRKTLCRTRSSGQSRNLVDKAISLIYEDGFAVNSKAVEALLRPSSLVPTKAGPVFFRGI